MSSFDDSKTCLVFEKIFVVELNVACVNVVQLDAFHILKSKKVGSLNADFKRTKFSTESTRTF